MLQLLPSHIAKHCQLHTTAPCTLQHKKQWCLQKCNSCIHVCSDTLKCTQAHPNFAATNMDHVFWDASSFNGDLSEWDISKVTNRTFTIEWPTLWQSPGSCLVDGVVDLRYCMLRSRCNDEWERFKNWVCTGHDGINSLLLKYSCWARASKLVVYLIEGLCENINRSKLNCHAR